MKRKIWPCPNAITEFPRARNIDGKPRERGEARNIHFFIRACGAYTLGTNFLGTTTGRASTFVNDSRVREFERSAGTRTNCSAPWFIYSARLFSLADPFPLFYADAPRARAGRVKYSLHAPPLVSIVSYRLCESICPRVFPFGSVGIRNGERARSFIYLFLDLFTPRQFCWTYRNCPRTALHPRRSLGNFSYGGITI